MNSYWQDRYEDFKPKGDDARTPYEVDLGRIVHSASFRRLQGKTQILNLGDSDFYRTRLTHSMEVSQVAYGIVQHLNKYEEIRGYLPSQSLIQSIGLLHDLGHPPFGHGGEMALNYCMHADGGFEGNGQTLRILTKHEKFSETNGANLTRRTLLGILKYPIPYSKARNKSLRPTKCKTVTGINLLDRKGCKPPKCYLDTEQESVNWLLEKVRTEDKNNFLETKKVESKHTEPVNKSLDCSIMDISDDISNGVHDLEDAIALGFVSRGQLEGHITKEVCKVYLDFLCTTDPKEFKKTTAYQMLIDKLFSDRGYERKREIGRLVNFFISHVEVETKAAFQEPLMKYNVVLKGDANDFREALAKFVRKTVIQNPRIQHLEFKGQQMVIDVFDIISHEPKRFLEKSTYALYKKADKRSAKEKKKHGGGSRVICDHISGMTDSYLLRLYERLLSPRMGSVFDKL